MKLTSKDTVLITVLSILLCGCTNTTSTPLVHSHTQNLSVPEYFKAISSEKGKTYSPLPCKTSDWQVFGRDLSRNSASNISFDNAALPLLWEFKPSDHTFSYRKGTNIWSESATAITRKDHLEITVGSYDRKLYTLNGDTGELLFSYNTGDEIIATPVLYDGGINLISSDRTSYGISPTGSRIWANLLQEWTHTCQPMVASSPALLRSKSGPLFSGGYYINDTAFFSRRQEGWFYITDCNTGKAVVSRHLNHGHVYGPAGNTQENSLVLYFTTSEGQVICLSPANGDIIWKFTADQKIRSTPAVTSISGKDLVIVTTRWGIVWALDADTGVPFWSYRAGHMVDSSPAIATLSEDKKIVIAGSYDRCVHGIDLQTGKRLWKFATGATVLASPAIGIIEKKQAAFFSSMDNTLYAVDCKNGEKIWSYTTGPLPWPYFQRGEAVFSSPIVCKTPTRPLVVFPCHDGILRAFSE